MEIQVSEVKETFQKKSRREEQNTDFLILELTMKLQ